MREVFVGFNADSCVGLIEGALDLGGYPT